MSKASVTALIQAILGSLGGLLIGKNIFGLAIDQEWIGTAIGVLVGVVSLVWGFVDHSETIEQFQAAIRNLMTFLTTLLIAGGAKDATINAITGAIDAILPVIYGFLSRAKNANIQKGTIDKMVLKTNLPETPKK